MALGALRGLTKRSQGSVQTFVPSIANKDQDDPALGAVGLDMLSQHSLAWGSQQNPEAYRNLYDESEGLQIRHRSNRGDRYRDTAS